MTDQKNTDKKTIGATGEQVAANFLKRKGYEILDMNFKNDSGRRVGELDIIAKDKETDEIVFVEVKTRDYANYGHTLPEENINYQKLRKLSKIAVIYLRKNHLADKNYRFDALSIWLDYTTRLAKIKHIQGL